jgi:hypothetical protein
MHVLLLAATLINFTASAVLAEDVALAGGGNMTSASMYLPHRPDQKVCRKIGNDIFIMGDLEIVNAGFGSMAGGMSDLTSAISVAKVAGDRRIFVWHAGDQGHPTFITLPAEWAEFTSDQVLEVCLEQDMGFTR